MSRIFNLNGKLAQLKHRVTPEDFASMKVEKEVFEKMIATEMYRQLADHIMKQVAIKTTTNKDKTIEFNARCYVLNERDMYNVILEICDLDDKGRDIIAKSVKSELDRLS